MKTASDNLIIYDFDGVIVNSERSVEYFYDLIFKTVDEIPPDWNDIYIRKDLLSMTHIDMIKKYAGSLEKEKIDTMLSIKITEEQENNIIELTTLNDSIKETLDILSRTHKLAICTNRSESIDKYLYRFNIKSYFSCVITTKNVERPKPSPEGLLKILHKLDKDGALYIGDSQIDEEAANSAGVRFLGYGDNINSTYSITNHQDIFKYL